MRTALVPVLLLLSSIAFSQDSGSVVIHKDPRIDLLIRKQSEINEVASRDARKVAHGFRLLVINTNQRDEAINAKTRLYQYFPELKSYLLYQSPYYKLKAGNFRERKDAEAYQKKVSAFFPRGVFIMNDLIEVRLDREPDDSL